MRGLETRLASIRDLATTALRAAFEPFEVPSSGTLPLWSRHNSLDVEQRDGRQAGCRATSAEVFHIGVLKYKERRQDLYRLWLPVLYPPMSQNQVTEETAQELCGYEINEYLLVFLYTIVGNLALSHNSSVFACRFTCRFHQKACVTWSHPWNLRIALLTVSQPMAGLFSARPQKPGRGGGSRMSGNWRKNTHPAPRYNNRFPPPPHGRGKGVPEAYPDEIYISVPAVTQHVILYSQSASYPSSPKPSRSGSILRTRNLSCALHIHPSSELPVQWPTVRPSSKEAAFRSQPSMPVLRAMPRAILRATLRASSTRISHSVSST